MTVNYALIKRIIDLILSVSLMIIFLPIWLIIGVCIIADTKRSPLFIQKRGLDLGSGIFRIFKLRTFRDTTSERVTHINLLYKPEQAHLISAFGKWLRKTGLDETPQLINILKGEMSFIGPRPLMLSDLRAIKKAAPDLYQRRSRIPLRPGLSGPWQLYKDESGSPINLLEMDEYYEKNIGFVLDMKLMIMSLLVAITGTHKDSVFMNTERTERKQILVINNE